MNIKEYLREWDEPLNEGFINKFSKLKSIIAALLIAGGIFANSANAYAHDIATKYTPSTMSVENRTLQYDADDMAKTIEQIVKEKGDISKLPSKEQIKEQIKKEFSQTKENIKKTIVNFISAQKVKKFRKQSENHWHDYQKEDFSIVKTDIKNDIKLSNQEVINKINDRSISYISKCIGVDISKNKELTNAIEKEIEQGYRRDGFTDYTDAYLVFKVPEVYGEFYFLLTINREPEQRVYNCKATLSKRERY